MGPIVIQFRPNVGAGRDGVRPPPGQVVAGHGDVACARLADAAVVQIPVETDLAVGRRIPIHAKASLRRVPVIRRVQARGQHRRLAGKALAIRPKVSRRTQGAAVARVPEATQFHAAAARDEESLRVLAIPADDVDDAVHGVGSPQRRTRPANHFNPVNVLQHRVLHVPKHTREQRRINAPPILQDQQLVGKNVIEAARRNRPGVGIDLSDVQPRHHSQQVGNICRSGSTNIFLSNNKNRRGHLRHLLLSL